MIAVKEPIKVLIVDNDNDILDVMYEAFSYEGFLVSGFVETDNIFPIITTVKPDIIILDYLLNGINGGEICHQIKTTATTAQLPVIIMSAYPNVVNSLGHYRCNAFIAKPFDLDHVINCINSLTQANQPSHLC